MSYRTNKEDILSSVNLNTKENKVDLKQKLNLLGKILSKGSDLSKNKRSTSHNKITSPILQNYITPDNKNRVKDITNNSEKTQVNCLFQ